MSANLSVQQAAELRKVARGEGVAVAHWVFAPMCWALLHQRGLLNVQYHNGRLGARITEAGRAALTEGDPSPEGQK